MNDLNLPISYFGPISYYGLMVTHQVKLEAHENYQKRTIRNRCHLLGPNGVQVLSVPLVKGKTKANIQEVRISYDEDWQKNHLETINTAYSSSPYYLFYIDRIKEIIRSDHRYLHDLNMATTAFICKALDIIMPLSSDSFKYPDALGEADLRYNDAFFFNSEERPYQRVFGSISTFTKGISSLDALFNLGPEAQDLINNETHDGFSSLNMRN